MNRYATTTIFALMFLTFASFAQGQTYSQRRSALRPRPDSVQPNGVQPNAVQPNAVQLDPAPRRGDAAGNLAIKQARNVRERPAPPANHGGDHGNGGGVDQGHGHGHDHGHGHYYPSYPIYGSGYYGYSIGNPGFNIPSYLAPSNGVYGYNYGYQNGYGYDYGYPFYGYPVQGRLSITTESSRSNTPGSHYFGDPHASQYIPKY